MFVSRFRYAAALCVGAVRAAGSCRARGRVNVTVTVFLLDPNSFIAKRSDPSLVLKPSSDPDPEAEMSNHFVKKL